MKIIEQTIPCGFSRGFWLKFKLQVREYPVSVNSFCGLVREYPAPCIGLQGFASRVVWWESIQTYPPSCQHEWQWSEGTTASCQCCWGKEHWQWCSCFTSHSWLSLSSEWLPSWHLWPIPRVCDDSETSYTYSTQTWCCHCQSWIWDSWWLSFWRCFCPSSQSWPVGSYCWHIFQVFQVVGVHLGNLFSDDNAKRHV